MKYFPVSTAIHLIRFSFSGTIIIDIELPSDKNMKGEYMKDEWRENQTRCGSMKGI